MNTSIPQDGFIRTLEENEAATEYDEADSELEFGNSSDEDASAPIFENEQPSSWNLTEAREAAIPQRPFQTSTDAKIRAQLSKVPERPAVEVEEPRLKKRKSETVELKPGKKMKQSIEEMTEEKKGKKKLRKEKAALGKTFEEFHLSRPLLKAVESLQWIQPTPIQIRAIPYILAGRDVCGSAETGSGKTGAFVLPILERLLQSGIDNVTRVVILLPTRELAAQCHSVVRSLTKYTSIRAALAVGGLSNKAQEVALRQRPHILVATPGRLIDHMRNMAGFSLDTIEVLILDEADRLLELGFRAEIEEIVNGMGRGQSVLFSATMNEGVKGLAKRVLKEPIRVKVEEKMKVAEGLKQEIVKVRGESTKEGALFALVMRTYKRRTMVFFAKKVEAHRMRILLGLGGVKVGELHGNLSQGQRLEALDGFREGLIDVLLCTDLAARGLDIVGVETVINYDMGGELREYVHRVGRTARAGKEGKACSIVNVENGEEKKLMKTIAKTGDVVERVLGEAVVRKWTEWIGGVQKNVREVLSDERREREMRMAEMEVKKAENMIRCEGEIYGRPKRTWFQTESERGEQREKAREEKGLGRKEKERLRKQMVEQKRKSEEQRERQGDYGKQRAQKGRIRKKRRPTR